MINKLEHVDGLAQDGSNSNANTLQVTAVFCQSIANDMQ